MRLPIRLPVVLPCRYWTGNEEPHIGFHSVGLLVDDVDAVKAAVAAAPRGAAAATDASAAAAAAAVASVVPAKADGIVFEPSTGYWVTLHKRPAAAAAPLGKLSWLHNAKLRVRNIAATLKFYETHFGATHLATVPLEGDAAAGASIYYVGWLSVGTPVPADPTSPAALEYLLTKRESTAVLGFLHTPGTEKDADFKGFHTGNVDPGRGFGHIGEAAVGRWWTRQGLVWLSRGSLRVEAAPHWYHRMLHTPLTAVRCRLPDGGAGGDVRGAGGGGRGLQEAAAGRQDARPRVCRRPRRLLD